MNEPTGEERSERLRLLSRVAPLFALAYGLLWLAGLDTHHLIPRDATTLVIGRDFLNFWLAGRNAWAADPGRFYDLVTYQPLVTSVVGPGYLPLVWSYPPSILLVAAPFGLMPYLPALLVWSILGPALLYVSMRRWNTAPRFHVALLFCPAAVFCLICGQFAFFAAALILNALRLREARPWLAGALIGLLTLKPQLGIFFPLLLLATRDWRVIAGAALMALALVGASTAIWGVDPWIAYWQVGIPTNSRLLSDPQVFGGPFMPTIYMNLHDAGVSTTVAGWFQAIATLAAAALIVWRFKDRPSANDWSANCLFLAASLFGTPYLMSYDTLPLTGALLLAMPHGQTGRWLTFATYFLTLLQLALGSAHIPGPALIPLLLAIYLAKQPASSTWVDQRNCPTGLTQSSL